MEKTKNIRIQKVFIDKATKRAGEYMTDTGKTTSTAEVINAMIMKSGEVKDEDIEGYIEEKTKNFSQESTTK